MVRRTVLLYNPLTAPTPLARRNTPLSVLALARMLPRDRYRPVVVNAAVDRQPHEQVLRELGDDAVLLGITAMTGHQLRDGLALARLQDTLVDLQGPGIDPSGELVAFGLGGLQLLTVFGLVRLPLSPGGLDVRAQSLGLALRRNTQTVSM